MTERHPIECATCGAIVGVHNTEDAAHLDALADRIVDGEDSGPEHVAYLSTDERSRLAAELRRRAEVCEIAAEEVEHEA